MGGGVGGGAFVSCRVLERPAEPENAALARPYPADMYWDAASGGFSSGGKWYSYDAATQQYVEWK